MNIKLLSEYINLVNKHGLKASFEGLNGFKRMLKG
jgi:hypothetical protein